MVVLTIVEQRRWSKEKPIQVECDVGKVVVKPTRVQSSMVADSWPTEDVFDQMEDPDGYLSGMSFGD